MTRLSAAALEGGEAWREVSGSLQATLDQLSAEFPGGGTATLSLPRGDGRRSFTSGSADPGLAATQLELSWRAPGPTTF